MRLKLRSLAPLLLTACIGMGEPRPRDLGPAPVMTLVSRPAETVPVGSEFPAAVRVRLTDASGESMASELVSFFFHQPEPGIHGGGIIGGSMTNAEGIAEMRFTPTRAGSFTVRAYFEECLRGFKSCEEILVRAEVSISGTALAP